MSTSSPARRSVAAALLVAVACSPSVSAPTSTSTSVTAPPFATTTSTTSSATTTTTTPPPSEWPAEAAARDLENFLAALRAGAFDQAGWRAEVEGGVLVGQEPDETPSEFYARVCGENHCVGEYDITEPVWNADGTIHGSWTFTVVHVDTGETTQMAVGWHEGQEVITGLPPLVASEPAPTLLDELFGPDAPEYVVFSRLDAFEVFEDGTSSWHTNPWAGGEWQVEAGFAAIPNHGVIPLDGSSQVIPFECPALIYREGAVLVLDRCWSDEHDVVGLVTGAPVDLPVEIKPGGTDGEWWGWLWRGPTFIETWGDAEGNLQEATNLDGVSLIGDDYPGHTILSVDGAWLVYGDHRGRVSPHWTDVVVVRDVTDGSEVGRWELSGVLTCLESDGRWVLVCLTPEEAVIGALQIFHEEVAVIDVSTGEVKIVETRARVHLPTSP